MIANAMEPLWYQYGPFHATLSVQHENMNCTVIAQAEYFKCHLPRIPYNVTAISLSICAYLLS